MHTGFSERERITKVSIALEMPSNLSQMVKSTVYIECPLISLKEFKIFIFIQDWNCRIKRKILQKSLQWNDINVADKSIKYLNLYCWFLSLLPCIAQLQFIIRVN